MMKGFIQKTLAALLICGVIFPTGRMGASAANDLIFEAESTPFTVTDDTGMTTSENKACKWAWSLNLSGASNVSGALTYFRDGGIGGTVDFEIEVDNAGSYAVSWAYRPHGGSYCTAEVFVNGQQIGGDVSLRPDDLVGGVRNVDSTVREITMGNADFCTGSNTVSFKMIEGGRDHDALAIDYIRLSDPVDESNLTFTEKDPGSLSPVGKENSTPVTADIPEGMLDVYDGVPESPQTTDKITVYPLAGCYQPSSLYTLKVDGVDVPVTSVGGDYEYAGFDYDPAKGSIPVEITCADAVRSLVASPRHLVEKNAEKSEKTVRLTLDCNIICNLSINGKNLVIAANPMQSDVPRSNGEGIFNVTKAPYNVTDSMSDAQRTAAIQAALDDASAYGCEAGHQNGVVYIPDGVYVVGNLAVGSNTYLYLEPTAVLRITGEKSLLSVDGCKTSMTRPDGGKGLDYTWWITTKFTEKNGKAEGSYDIRIGGRGTVDARGMENWQNLSLGSNSVIPIACSYFTMEGITVREAGCWSVVAVRSDHMTFSWLKLYERLNMEENDAIDVCECQHVTVQNCAGYSQDDAFSAKTWPYKVGITLNWPGSPEYNDDIVFENNLAYTIRSAFKVGQGTDQNHYNLTFRNNTVVYARIGICIHCLSGTGTVYDTLFENFYIEKLNLDTAMSHAGWLMFCTEPNSRGNGNVRNVTVRNIFVYSGAEGTVRTEIGGCAQDSTIENVLLSDIYYDGVRAKTLDELKPKLEANEFTANIRMENSAEPSVENPDSPSDSGKDDRPESSGSADAGSPNRTPDLSADGDFDEKNDGKNGAAFLIWGVPIGTAALIAGGIAAIWIRKKRRKS